MPHQTLKEELEAKIADAERKHARDHRSYDGDDWWELNTADQAVFGIHPVDWPRMMLTWHCWECFADTGNSGEFSEPLLEAARAQFPTWHEDKNHQRDFLAFAKEFGDLSNRDAFAVLRKVEAWELRAGVYSFWDGS